MKKFVNQFGGKVTPELKKLYAQSQHWRDNKFQNLEETTMSINFQTLPKLLYKQFCEKEGREPKQSLPIQGFDKEKFLAESKESKFIWYGHSAVLARINNKTILIDPMLGENASPIAPFSTRRFSEGTLNLIDEFPEIDLVLLTHDHYDHLDLDSIKRLKAKVKNYFVALGVGRHLIQWGIKADQIVEFDWWDQKDFHEITITFTPTRHFSGRGISDRAMTLWGGWALKTTTENIWFSGDSGYGEHFRDVGKRLGPFDFSFMECGQYNENWRQIHMYPEESVRAAQEVQSKLCMPVHWGAFSLAQHIWTEPADRFIASCYTAGLPYIVPALGQLFSLQDHAINERWWIG